jgi:hypothetical protein
LTHLKFYDIIYIRLRKENKIMEFIIEGEVRGNYTVTIEAETAAEAVKKYINNEYDEQYSEIDYYIDNLTIDNEGLDYYLK